MPQFENPQIVLDLNQRGFSGLIEESGFGAGSGLLHGISAQHIDAEQGQQLFGEQAIIAGGCGGEVKIRCWVNFGHIQAAIGREAIEQCAGKGAGCVESASAYIVHFVTNFVK